MNTQQNSRNETRDADVESGSRRDAQDYNDENQRQTQRQDQEGGRNGALDPSGNMRDTQEPRGAQRKGR